jgi:hypothetical protein
MQDASPRVMHLSVSASYLHVDAYRQPGIKCDALLVRWTLPIDDALDRADALNGEWRVMHQHGCANSKLLNSADTTQKCDALLGWQ